MSETSHMYQCGHCDYKAPGTPSLVLHHYLNHPGQQFQQICLPSAMSPDPLEDPPVSPVRQDESREQVETNSDIAMDKKDPAGVERNVSKDPPTQGKNTKRQQFGRKKKKAVETFFQPRRLSLKRKKRLRSKGSDRSKKFQCGWCKFSANQPMFILAHHKSRHPSRELDIIMLEPSGKCKNELTLSPSEEEQNCPVFDNCPDVEDESFDKSKGYVLKLSTHSGQIQFHCAYCSYTGHLRHQLKMHCRKEHPNKTFLIIEPGFSGGTCSDSSNDKFYNEEVVDIIASETDQYAARHELNNATKHEVDNAARDELDNGLYSELKQGLEGFKFTPVAVKCIDVMKCDLKHLHKIIQSKEINCINIDSLEDKDVINLILKGREKYSFYIKEACRDSVCLNVLTPQEIQDVIMR
ncbi:hypothetical protein CHS0354_024643 [Potamilus streckersoni]|uniref:C2H2-type domain-containing protein n=1 Tax=Potamilus streckersoni TaxID=2493646 RepID=A0AAE0SVN6_9BIVA|nr:hypothetical protein CHS0354_024643 [Potamilus streckersoni]